MPLRALQTENGTTRSDLKTRAFPAWVGYLFLISCINHKATLSAWYSRHHPGSQTGSVTVIQRASSDLRLNPHFHTLFLDGVYLPPQQPEAADATMPTPIFQVAPKLTQADIDFVVERTRERILKYLQKRGVITFAAAPGDDEVSAILGEGFGKTDPAHSTLLSAATSGSPPAGPAHKRKPVLMLSEAEMSPEHKGYLCAQLGAFNLHAARRVAGNDKQGKEMLCRYILRPPLANERLHLLAMVKTEETIQSILSAMHLPTGPPKVVQSVPVKTVFDGKGVLICLCPNHPPP